jgi:biotin operon repressor
MKSKFCCDCGAKLNKNEVALTKKLLSVDTDYLYCLPCLASYLGCDEKDLRIKITEFKEQGCTLFL